MKIADRENGMSAAFRYSAKAVISRILGGNIPICTADRR
jgi:hypothetical protein